MPLGFLLRECLQVRVPRCASTVSALPKANADAACSLGASRQPVSARASCIARPRATCALKCPPRLLCATHHRRTNQEQLGDSGRRLSRGVQVEAPSRRWRRSPLTRRPPICRPPAMAQPLSLFQHIVMASSSRKRPQLLGGDGLETNWGMAAWEGRRAEVGGAEAVGRGRERRWCRGREQQVPRGFQGCRRRCCGCRR